MKMLLLSIAIIFVINVLSKVNKKWDEKLDIVSGSFIWCGVAICISLYNGISFDGGIHYNFEAMKSYNYLIGICILSCAFYNVKILNPFTVFYILCIATMILNKNYFFTLEPYARTIIALCAYASFFHFVVYPLGRKFFK